MTSAMYNKLVDTYVNDLMANHTLESEYEITEYSPTNNVLVGGAPPRDRPNGGFPPIHMCDDKDRKIIKAPPREFAAPTGTVSIKSILEQRKRKRG